MKVAEGMIQLSLPSVLSFVQGEEIEACQISSSLAETAWETRPMTKAEKEEQRAPGSKFTL